MNLIIAFILGMFAGAGLLSVICIAIGSDGENPTPPSKDDWRDFY